MAQNRTVQWLTKLEKGERMVAACFLVIISLTSALVYLFMLYKSEVNSHAKDNKSNEEKLGQMGILYERKLGEQALKHQQDMQIFAEQVIKAAQDIKKLIK